MKLANLYFHETPISAGKVAIEVREMFFPAAIDSVFLNLNLF